MEFTIFEKTIWSPLGSKIMQVILVAILALIGVALIIALIYGLVRFGLSIFNKIKDWRKDAKSNTSN